MTQDNKPVIVYHGTSRPDRIGDKFDPKRATSGPMAFFTSDPQMASSYATNKRDTSIQIPDSYIPWFNIKVGKKYYPIDKAWYYLSQSQRNEISNKLPHISNTDDNGEEIDGYRIISDYGVATKGTWDYELKQARGNMLLAALEIWLNSGVLYGEESEFIKVLRMAGIDAEFNNPHATYPAVVPVYLSISNPLVTSDIPKDVIEALRVASRRRRRNTFDSRDQWDKRNFSGKEWIEKLDYDIQNGTTHCWTSIPDWVTDTLKALGYNGIRDVGGKYNPVKHDVWIPFYSNQIKSAYGNVGDYSSDNPKIKASVKNNIFRI